MKKAKKIEVAVKAEEKKDFAALLKVLEVEVDKIVLREDNPLYSYNPTTEREAELAELYKKNSPASAILIRMKDNIPEALSHYELIHYAWKKQVKTLYCHAVNVDDEEAYYFPRYNQDGADKWTLVDEGIHIHNAPKSADIEITLAEYARRAGCSRTAITFAHQAASVALFAKENGMAGKFGLLRHKGTHLRYIYQSDQKHWVNLCADMLAGDWSAKRTEEAVKDLKAASESTDTSSVATAKTGNSTANYTVAADNKQDTPPPSPVDTLQSMRDAILTFQSSLTDIAKDIKEIWESLTDTDKESVQNIGRIIKQDLAAFLLMFSTGYPLECLVVRKTEITTTLPEPADTELAESLANASQEALID